MGGGAIGMVSSEFPASPKALLAQANGYAGQLPTGEGVWTFLSGN